MPYIHRHVWQRLLVSELKFPDFFLGHFRQWLNLPKPNINRRSCHPVGYAQGFNSGLGPLPDGWHGGLPAQWGQIRSRVSLRARCQPLHVGRVRRPGHRAGQALLKDPLPLVFAYSIIVTSSVERDSNKSGWGYFPCESELMNILADFAVLHRIFAKTFSRL